MTLESSTNLEDVLDIRFAGGVSTLEGGFMIGWFKDKELPAICLAINRQGEVFARFMKDETVHHAKNLSRAESEAIAGIKYLILGWRL
jgi:hypothetical protein